MSQKTEFYAGNIELTDSVMLKYAYNKLLTKQLSYEYPPARANESKGEGYYGSNCRY